MKIKIICVVMALCCVSAGQKIFAQSTLNKYIEEGIAKNIVLSQKKISLENATYSLKIATSLFFPSINFEGDYNSGEGGRNILIPVGEMLNPVYATLNQLTQSSKFPQLNEIKINFFPFHFYDLKLSATMPVINTDLIINRGIQEDQLHLNEFEVEVYKKELIKEIKTAYFNYLSAVSTEKIYQNALNVADEGKRVNESLLKNGKGLPVYILRSDIDS
jgi:outer membrane protein TolC